MHDGTAVMAATLAEVAARASADPRANAFLNRARADAIQQILRSQSGDVASSNREQLAQERLRAGDTRRAIAIIDSVIADAGLSWERIPADRKSLFDLSAVAQLRLGEQENCLTNPAANICILPLKGGARHAKPEGARGAITRYTHLFEQFPDDRGSQWLLNIAYLQIGGYPDSVPKRFLVPGLDDDGRVPFPEYTNVAGRVGLDIHGHAGALSIDDFNGDGLLDVFTTSWAFHDPVHVMLADGAGGYTDRTADAGLTGITGGLNSVHADYDNDGDVDIVVLRGAWQGETAPFPFSLLRNRADGRFDDVTIESGLLSLGAVNSAAWADYDLDGDIDLFVGYESYARLRGTTTHRSKLFRNDGRGHFADVASDVGIVLDDFAKGVTWGDVNNDGLPDLFVSVLYGTNKLYMNRGAQASGGWRFDEVAAQAGVEAPIASFPAWFWDYDNDGWLDLFVASYDVNGAMHDMVAREFLGLPLRSMVNGKPVGVETSRVYRNKGDGTFADMTAQVGLSGTAIYAMGSNFGDLDNDGWLDFYLGTGNPDLRSVIPSRMFRSVDGARFDEVTLPGGFGHLQKGHATAFADLDRDGHQDVFMVMGGAYEGEYSNSVLFTGPAGAANDWINLTLEGRSANRSALGARVDVVVVDGAGARRTIRRVIGTGGSFGSGPLELHVGLGPAARVQEVVVRWPDQARSRSVYAGLPANRHYRIVQGMAPAVLTRPAVPFRQARARPSAGMPMPMAPSMQH